MVGVERGQFVGRQQVLAAQARHRRVHPHHPRLLVGELADQALVVELVGDVEGVGVPLPRRHQRFEEQVEGAEPQVALVGGGVEDEVKLPVQVVDRVGCHHVVPFIHVCDVGWCRPHPSC